MKKKKWSELCNMSITQEIGFFVGVRWTYLIADTKSRENREEALCDLVTALHVRL